VSLHPNQENVHPLATGPGFQKWRFEQIAVQCSERHEAWVRAGRPRPECPPGKWVGDKGVKQAANFEEAK
jgi:hypothetical protein